MIPASCGQQITQVGLIMIADVNGSTWLTKLPCSQAKQSSGWLDGAAYTIPYTKLR